MVSLVRVKICGIMNSEVAQAAVALGADALGFVFASSRRQVSPDNAEAIIRGLPPFVAKVGVFVNTNLREVQEVVNYCGLDAVQLHGDEGLEFYRKLKCKVIKAVRVKGEESVRDALTRRSDAFLFDTYKKGVHGGTGETFDWDILKRFDIPAPVILSGGLSPDNVRQAVQTVKPYAVDVSSGVETNGIKNIEKIEAFIRQAKGV